MSRYQLTSRCLDDLEEILTYTAKHHGQDAADALEEELLTACERLAAMPGLGHRRQDLTSRPQFFYPIDAYLIVYVRETDPLRVMGILHASRNIRKLLKSRPEF